MQPIGDKTVGPALSAGPFRLGRLGLAFGGLMLAWALLAVLASGAAAWGADARAQWLLTALTGRVSRLCLAVAIPSAALLTLVGGVLAMLGRSQRRRRQDGQEGNAVLEFAMALPIALMMVLLMTQSSLLMAGNLCVHYSAYCAARAAIVQIPMDYSASDVADGNLLTDKKRFLIKRSAEWAVLPVSCSNSQAPSTPGSSLANGLTAFMDRYGRSMPGWTTQTHLDRKLQYAQDYTTLEIRPPEAATSQPSSGEPTPYAANEDIHVTIRHTLYLSVPYAGRLFAEVLDSANGRELGFGSGLYGLNIDASCLLTNEGVQDWVKQEQFPGDP